MADWLKARGWRVLPVYDYSGKGDSKAPRFEGRGPITSLVMPDLLAARDGELRFVEVKYKTRPDYTRATGRLETGISLRLFRDYQAVEACTGAPVWIVWIHGTARPVASTLAKVEQNMRVYEGPKMGRGGMIFVPLDALDEVPGWEDSDA